MRITADEVREHLAPHYARGQVPERVEFVDTIPRTSTGKCWKVRLRERFAVEHAATAAPGRVGRGEGQ